MKVAEPNTSVSYPKEKAERLECPGLHKASAIIYVMETEVGWIVAGATDHSQGSYAGAAGPLSTHFSFETRTEAIHYEANWIGCHAIGVVRDGGSVVTDAQKAEAAKIVEWCRELVHGKPQMELFA